MTSMTKLIAGLVVAVGSSWAAMVAYPFAKLATLQPEVSEETGGLLPPPLPGNAIAGQRVYAANGCVHCHSQQVRPAPFATDIARDLGTRQTVARDYLRYDPAFLGLVRTGPDLSNVGVRHQEAAWFFRHLYEPEQVTPGSIMPSFRYLFEEREIQGQRSALAVDVQGPHAPKPGYEIVPKQDAIELVAYLMSLKRDYPLTEAPPPPPAE
jgi:Cbb3-type cytochrome oxidase, cytochrome c subunit